jgi:DNA sulfur modification protein DndC
LIDGLTPQASLDTTLAAKLAAVRSELLDEYRLAHGYPWVIGYSGGKDSTLVVHLVFELLLALAPSERRRPVRIVANNTLVESPLVIRHIEKMFEHFQLAIDAFDLPIKLDMTRPAADNTFWVNLIGRGYPSPTRSGVRPFLRTQGAQSIGGRL